MAPAAPRRSLRTLRFLSGLLLFLSACGSPCPAGFLGEAGAAPELLPAALDRESGGLVRLSDGDPVELLRPIQGGHVLFIGAFVRGVLTCGGSLRGELRRDAAGQPGAILVSDERSSELMPIMQGAGAAGAPGPGFGAPAPDINEVPNIPACPNVLPDEFLDKAAWLQLTFTARDGVQATGRVRVAPRCQQGDPALKAACRCECLANYTIDRCVM